MAEVPEIKLATPAPKMEHPYLKGSGIVDWPVWFGEEMQAEEAAIDNDPTGEQTGWKPYEE